MRTSAVNYLIAYCCLHCTIPVRIQSPTFMERSRSLARANRSSSSLSSSFSSPRILYLYPLFVTATSLQLIRVSLSLFSAFSSRCSHLFLFSFSSSLPPSYLHLRALSPPRSLSCLFRRSLVKTSRRRRLT